MNPAKTATSKTKEAREYAEKYRNQYATALSWAVAAIEDFTGQERQDYENTKLQECRLPWEKTK